MPIRKLVVPPVLFIRWVQRCEADDVEAIKQATEAAHVRVGDELVYIAIIPIDVAPPDTEARAALRAGTEHASRHCRSVHIVIEGQGLRRALIRSISAALLLATRKSSRGFHIHETVDQAMDAAHLHGAQRTEILATAGENGLLS
jgi:hypothetical protein